MGYSSCLWQFFTKPSNRIKDGVRTVFNSIGFSKLGDKYIGTPYTTMDCQGFVEKMLEDAGIKKNLKGSNAWYREMTWVGTPEECKKIFGAIPVGAFLFI